MNGTNAFICGQEAEAGAGQAATSTWHTVPECWEAAAAGATYPLPAAWPAAAGSTTPSRSHALHRWPQPHRPLGPLA